MRAASGWGVVASGPDNKPRNERQESHGQRHTSGSFILDFKPSFNQPGEFVSGFQVTAPIEYNASAAVVQSAIEGPRKPRAGGCGGQWDPGRRTVDDRIHWGFRRTPTFTRWWVTMTL